ncbi:MAG: hypothetical protein M3N25_04605 [Actinomycetota bacterium]|nr:hypothetical protein [Actinomycetota bacterium]MDP9020073.1 hypothetical protein [Actinomycetota bacterium]
MGKQMEGDNRQRRERAKDARDEGRAPSAEGVTTGASVQRRHLSDQADHGERIAGPGWGKQEPERAAPDPRPGSVADRGGATSPTPPTTGSAGPEVNRQPGNLDEDEQRLFEAVVRRELDQGASTLRDLAADVGLSTPEAEAVLRRLVDHHDVVQQLPGETDGEDLGPRYRAKARV